MKKKLKQLKRQRADIKRGLKTKARGQSKLKKHLTTKNSITAKKGKDWVKSRGKKPDMVKE